MRIRAHAAIGAKNSANMEAYASKIWVRTGRPYLKIIPNNRMGILTQAMGAALRKMARYYRRAAKIRAPKKKRRRSKWLVF